MAQIWPPPPSVEDEEASLAREHGPPSASYDTEAGKSPVDSRGAVDQHPIILDVNAKVEASKAAVKPKVGPTTRTTDSSTKAHVEKRFVFVSQEPKDACLAPSPLPQLSRSKSTTRLAGEDYPRGRPQVTRIQTDFGNGLNGSTTDQRPGLSPYENNVPLSGTRKAPTKASLLSPDTALKTHLSNGTTPRSRSAHPDRRVVVIENSDSDHKTSSHRYRSRSRVDRSQRSKHSISSGEDAYFSADSRRYDSDRRKSRREPSRRRSRPEDAHRSAHGDITPPQTPRLSRDSPQNSAAEDSDHRRRRDRSRHPEKRLSKESTHGSSADEGRHRKEDHENSKPDLSRRGSMRRMNRPHLDLSDPQVRGRFNPDTPMTTRTPKALEDYFQKAYEDNQQRQANAGPAYSARPSPLSSPPQSPPRTPTGDRSGRDYFGSHAPSSAPKQNSRPPSTSETQFRGLNSLLGAATLGAASLSSKAMPNLSRSSTASIDTPSSGSQSSADSTNRSLKPSIVFEEPKPISRTSSYVGKDELPSLRSSLTSSQHDRPLSRAGSYTGREETPLLRSGPRPSQFERPVSRAGSYAGHEDLTHSRPSVVATQHERPVSRAGSLTGPEDSASIRSNTYPPREERPSSRSGPISAQRHDSHAPTQRSFSYTSASDQANSRPSARRIYSTANGATVTVGSSQHSRTPTQPNATWQTRPTPAAPVERKAIALPPCPHSRASGTTTDWYTIQGVQEFDVCKSCMSVLGNSAFRDYCVPSRWRSGAQQISCALSRPWIRLAVTQCLQTNLPNLQLLSDLNSKPAQIFPCPGKRAEVRKWYHVNDPQTKQPISSFDACTACVRSAELLFPELSRMQLFQRPEYKLNQERVCNLNTDSKHFYAFINRLEQLANWSKAGKLHKSDIPEFATFVRRKTRLRECARDSMLGTPLWHYMRQLPEFTVCEECYEEVVLPVMNKPVAKDIVPTLQPVPTQRPERFVQGISCQLYSDRMRSLFRDAVARNDLEGFKRLAYSRYHMEHKLQETHGLLVMDIKAGIDRREDIEKNSALWKAYE